MPQINEYLDTNGDGTGDNDAIGNYASAAEDFYFQATTLSEIHRLLVTVEDTQPMQAANYGNGIVLTNGIRIFLHDSTTVTEVPLDGGLPVLRNLDWGSLCYDVDLKTWGSGNQALLVRFTFARGGQPLLLDAGDRIIVRLNDSFVGLISHKFMIQGIRI